MKSLKIYIEGDQVGIQQEGELTVNEGLMLSFELFANVALQTSEAFGEDKDSRRNLYNQVVQSVSALANKIYPEIEEEKGTPEDFLAHLEEKSLEIDKKQAELDEKLKKLEENKEE
jgi:hypothetical protein